MNYFDFFGLEPKFNIHSKALKLLYYEKMKEFHPDMQVNASPEEQAEVLRMSSINNEAYKTLKDFHLRLKYILSTYYPGNEPPSTVLPQMFLMEMMDMNDDLEEIKNSNDQTKADAFEKQVLDTLEEMKTEIENVVKDASVEEASIDVFDQINEYLLKKNYLHRAISNVRNEEDI